jgi:hypothetical protein
MFQSFKFFLFFLAFALKWHQNEFDFCLASIKIIFLFTGIKVGITVLIHREASMNVNILPLSVTFLPDASLFRLMRVSNSLSEDQETKEIDDV